MADDLNDYYKDYNYGGRKPIYIKEEELRTDQLDRLIKSDVFCIIPWIHMHAFPDGRAYPCCLSEPQHPIGNLNQQSMKEVWNEQPMRDMRKNMMNEQPCKECTKCYEQEKSKLFSMRESSNKNFGHHVGLVDETKDDGTFEDFKLRYYDIRFSNLCNLRCRSCGHIFSSQWYQDQAKLAGSEWKLHNSVLNYAGRTESDMWEQLEPHLDYVEQIYFAGGEPLVIEEHYQLLEEMIRQGRTDIKLIYNTKDLGTKHQASGNKFAISEWNKVVEYRFHSESTSCCILSFRFEPNS